jgi:hypothetical protein
VRHRDRFALSRDGLRVSPTGRRLRLGVLTFHRCINYGSYWQARCLVEGLRALGHEAVLLDHHDPVIARKEHACALQPLLPVRSDRADRRRHAAKVRAFAAAQARLPRSSPFPLSGPPEERFDAIVIGSDEVWNPSHPWYAGAGLFWGEGLEHLPLIAHAASSGSHVAPLPDDRAAALARFAAIAVRDRTTQAHVHAATGVVPSLVLDPCLQFPPEPARPLRRAPYALVYGHDFPDWAGPAVRGWAASHGLQLLSVGYRNAFADAQWLESGPGGFASAVTGAAAMVTTMFHGSVFALNARLPFAAIPSDYRATKLTDLTTLLGARRHLVHEPEGLGAALAEPPDAAVIDGIVALRARSHGVLRHALA